ncbi:MAG: nickel-type superoxide dismutase maturation protease [Acidimicrobiales bacterium]
MIIHRPLLDAGAELLAWAGGRRRRYRVTGASMEPTLHAGEQMLVADGGRPRPGDVVVARHPERPDLVVVKRVAAVTDDDRITLASDNPAAGTDSRRWGPVAGDTVLGRVVLVLDRPTASLLAPTGSGPSGPSDLSGPAGTDAAGATPVTPAEGLWRWLRR